MYKRQAQAFALLVVCGTEPKVEAFLAAYAIYLPIAVLASSLRATVSGLVSREADEGGASAGDVVSRCVLFGGLVAAVMLVLAPLLAPTLSGDLRADAGHTTLLALCLLLPAAFMHVVAAALSGALGAAHEFRFSALAYVSTGTISLAVSIAMLWAIGPLGAGVGVLTGTLLLAGAHLRRARSHGIVVRLSRRAMRDRAQWRLVAEVLSGAALGFALQANFAISLAAVGSQAGSITAYSYAFFMTSMILSLSSLPLALVSLPALVGEVRRRGDRAVADHIVKYAPFAFAAVLPLVAGFLGFGRAIIGWVIEPFTGVAVADLMFAVGQSLVLMTVPATLFYLASAASLPATTPRARLAAAGLTTGVHAVAVALVAGDPRAVAWAHAVAMLAGTAFLLAQVLRRQTISALVRATRAVGPVALAAVPLVVLGLLVGSTASVAATTGAALLAIAGYVLALRSLAPAVLAPFVALLRRTAIA